MEQPTVPPLSDRTEENLLSLLLMMTRGGTFEWSAEAVFEELTGRVTKLRQAAGHAQFARARSEYHEDYGDVLWWLFPVEEAPYVGSPLDSSWPGYHTHWTPLPPVPKH